MSDAPTKFKFDTVFAQDGDHVSLSARGRQRKSLTQEEIDSMCARARSEGAKTSEARAAEAVAKGVLEVADAVRHTLASAHLDIETLREETAQLALAIARKLAPAALDALPAADVERALREGLHQAIGEPRVVLRAAPRVIEALQARIAEIALEEGYDGRVVLSPDPAIQGADCRIEWRGGGAERSEAAIEEALTALIAHRFSHSVKE